ncbi:hypothetical protein FOPG_14616 [Fusarium oxysporum f. sp. conglutinans race 2 54008]|uniref:Uncharacterized protein n=1 Tax=Fusarium oxysporum f. sp. conglutinans race 2 54008 TaxID=1089457 RepID=X0HBY8_FUSOX|nr:hypothetical protein FOPG_14616 [Fusarium oxysporum f. sp. conglutinans race 2 54008]
MSQSNNFLFWKSLLSSDAANVGIRLDILHHDLDALEDAESLAPAHAAVELVLGQVVVLRIADQGAGVAQHVRRDGYTLDDDAEAAGQDQERDAYQESRSPAPVNNVKRLIRALHKGRDRLEVRARAFFVLATIFNVKLIEIKDRVILLFDCDAKVTFELLHNLSAEWIHHVDKGVSLNPTHHLRNARPVPTRSISMLVSRSGVFKPRESDFPAG